MNYKLIKTVAGVGAVVYSTQIAEELGRRHWQVMRGIKSVIKQLSEEEARKHFYKSVFYNKTNAPYDCYYMTETGFKYLMQHLHIPNVNVFREPYDDEFKHYKEITEKVSVMKPYVNPIEELKEEIKAEEEHFKEKVAQNLYKQFYEIAEQIEEAELDIYVTSRELLNKIQKRNELIKDKQLNHLIKLIDDIQLQKDFEFAGLNVIHE